MFHLQNQSIHRQLNDGQVFAPVNDYLCEDFNSPRLRKPARAAKFLMLETPCIRSIKYVFYFIHLNIFFLKFLYHELLPSPIIFS